MTKNLQDYITESLNEGVDPKQRTCVYDKMENSDMDHGDMKKNFLKKFKGSKAADFEKIVDNFMDM